MFAPKIMSEQTTHCDAKYMPLGGTNIMADHGNYLFMFFFIIIFSFMVVMLTWTMLAYGTMSDQDDNQDCSSMQ